MRLVDWLSLKWLGIASFKVVALRLVWWMKKIGITRFREYSLKTVVEAIRQKVADERNHFWLAHLFLRSPPPSEENTPSAISHLHLHDNGGGSRSSGQRRRMKADNSGAVNPFLPYFPLLLFL